MDSDRDALQRALNEAKKRELREQFGAEFHSGDRELSPDVEGRWLREIEEFERRFASAPEVTVRAFIGDPPILPLGAVPPGELSSALGGLLGILRSNDIEIAFGRQISPAEAYRFLTEEILSETIADVRIEGLTLQFLYEEYHPVPGEGAIAAAELFFHALAERNIKLLLDSLSATEALDADGSLSSPEHLRAEIRRFLEGSTTVCDFEAEIGDVQITDGRVRVIAEISWSAFTPGGLPPGGLHHGGLHHGGFTRVSGGTGILTLKERTGRWEIVQVILPRTDFSPHHPA